MWHPASKTCTTHRLGVLVTQAAAWWLLLFCFCGSKDISFLKHCYWRCSWGQTKTSHLICSISVLLLQQVALAFPSYQQWSLHHKAADSSSCGVRWAAPSAPSATLAPAMRGVGGGCLPSRHTARGTCSQPLRSGCNHKLLTTHPQFTHQYSASISQVFRH